jgi:hypothetical protein
MITSLAEYTTTITTDVTTAHKLFDLLNDWIDVFNLTGYGSFEINTIAWLLGLI